MEVTIKFIGIIFVSLSVCFLIRPEWMHNIFDFFSKRSRIYIVGVIRLFLAVTFLLAARECRNPYIIGAIGLLCLISGIYTLAAGADKMRTIIEWIQKRPLWLFRVFSAVHFLGGCLIIYAA